MEKKIINKIFAFFRENAALPIIHFFQNFLARLRLPSIFENSRFFDNDHMFVNFAKYISLQRKKGFLTFPKMWENDRKSHIIFPPKKRRLAVRKKSFFVLSLRV